jgi:Flp pilus assembly protein TadG
MIMHRLMQNLGRQAQRQRGIVVVETVIVLPVVLFLLLAVAELGNAILQYNVLTRSVRDSARYVASAAAEESPNVINLTAAKITTAQNLAVYGTSGSGTAVLPGLTPGNITVALVNTNDVSVSARYQYQPLFAGNIPALVGTGNAGGAFTMNAQVIMRIL